MPHIQSFTKPLKCHKLLDLSTIHHGKDFYLGYIPKLGGSNIFYLSKEGLEKIAEKVNPFWKNVFLIDQS